MNIEQLREYCINKPHVEESFPFGEDTLVFKVSGKIFALISLDEPETPRVNLKGLPEKNTELRERYEGVIPGYHMNKAHWNTVLLESDVNDKLLRQMTDESYSLIVSGLPKKIRDSAGL